MKKSVVLYAFLALGLAPGIARADARVKEATDLILKLCIASGIESIEVKKKGDSIEVSGNGDSLQIYRRESSGLVGGISKEITALSAQQASEARSCTQKHLKRLVDIILNDESENQIRSPSSANSNRQLLIISDPDAFWEGKGILADNQNYCHALLEFLSASSDADNFCYADNGERVSLSSVSPKVRRLEGNFFIKTEIGSLSHFCAVFYNNYGRYSAIACSRAISFGRRDVFASVYNQTLKDMRDCLLPAGWKQTSLDQGACIPIGRKIEGGGDERGAGESWILARSATG